MPQSVDVRYLISIHALAKRATTYMADFETTVYISIHALAKRATIVDLFTASLKKFQSTPSQRGRHFFQIYDKLTEIFQSTPSQRGRLILIQLQALSRPFQSTPSQRGRQSLSTRTQGTAFNFNPRPRKEGDQTRGLAF